MYEYLYMPVYLCVCKTILWIYRVIQNDCRGFNNLWYTKMGVFVFFNLIFVTRLTGALYVHTL